MSRRPSMEGRTIVRPDDVAGAAVACLNIPLQWRAGQLSGQTQRALERVRGLQHPSMEGRTIVRPDDSSTNSFVSGDPPSMEGRTIVRPDWKCLRSSGMRWLPFNGGPDNCPARRRSPRPFPARSPSFNGGPDNCPARPVGSRRLVNDRHSPSMEGRTIVRPDALQLRRSRVRIPPFNGGPDNCPARRVCEIRHHRSPLPFNGGPDNCPARPRRRRRRRRAIHAFNGGPDNCPARLQR